MDDYTTQIKTELTRISRDVTAGLGSNRTQLEQHQARLLDLEQKVARAGGAGYEIGGNGNPNAALRDLLENSEDLAAVADRKSRRAVLEMPTGFFATITSGGGLPMPDVQPGIVAPQQRRFTVRSLIPSIATSAGSVQYTRESSFANAAAPVSESTLKPESGISFELKTTAVIVIAHWIHASLQILSDTPQLMAYIQNRLRYGLAYATDLQLLKGSGAGANLSGLLINATAYNRVTALDTKADAIRRAVTQLEDTDYVPDAIVLHPFDVEAISLLKDSQGRYLVGAPGGANPATLWNLPIVSTSAMTAGTFLVGAFAQSALVFDREQARIDVATEDQDDFVKNLCKIRAEERLGLAVMRPGGLIKGTFV